MKKNIIKFCILLLFTILSLVTYSQSDNKRNSLIINYGISQTDSSYNKSAFNISANPFVVSTQYKYNIYKRFNIFTELYFSYRAKWNDNLNTKEDFFNFTYSLNFGYDIIKRKKIEINTSIGGGRQKLFWNYIYLKNNSNIMQHNRIWGFDSWGWNANIDARYIFKNNSFLGTGYNFKSYGGFYFHTFQMSFGVKF